MSKSGRVAMWTRRQWLGLGLLGASMARAARPIGVLAATGLPAHEEALAGLRERLAEDGLQAELIRRDQLPSSISAYPLLVAMGREAVEKVPPVVDPNMLLTMVLREEMLATSHKPAAGVLLDLAPSAVLLELTKLVGAKLRVGVILNPARPSSMEGGLAALSRQGLPPLIVAASAGPENLLKAFLSLRGRADLVVTGPDNVLYSTTTVKPLIMASLENRLPLVGFSAAFARAGAAISVYPDFRDVGAQSAELALRMLAGAKGREEHPRKLVLAANQKVCRLLGLELDWKTKDLVVLR